MTIEIEIYFGNTKDQEVISKMTSDFIFLATHLDSLVIKNGPNRWSNSGNFYALSSGIIIHAYGVQDEASARIESELKPIMVTVNRGKSFRGKRDSEYQIDLSWQEVDSFDALPKKIAEALQNDPNHLQCPACERSIKLDMGVKFCPYCRESLNIYEWDAGLTYCAECREDPEGGSLYHHSYDFCPRCGKKLGRFSDVHWFDYVGKEEEFLGGGQPINEFELADEIPKKASRKKRKIK